jgi:hypothetical protein
MRFGELLAELEAEIQKLKSVRALLVSQTSAKPKLGRPKAITPDTTQPAKKKKRNLTPDGRRRIAEAVKRRWEKQRKTAGK